MVESMHEELTRKATTPQIRTHVGISASKKAFSAFKCPRPLAFPSRKQRARQSLMTAPAVGPSIKLQRTTRVRPLPIRAYIICRLAPQNAGAHGGRESASIRRLLRWKSSFYRAHRPARPL